MGFSIPGTGAVGKALDWGKDQVSEAADQVADVAQKGGEAVKSTVSTGARGLRDVVGVATHPIAAATTAADRVRNKASDVVDGAHDRVTSTVDRVRNKANDVVDGARDRVAGAVDRVRDKASDVVGGARDRITGAADRVRDGAGDLWDRAGDAVDGARDRAADVVDQGGDIASDAWDIARAMVTPSGFDRKVHELSAPVDDLGPGDSVAFNAGGEVNAAVSGSGGASVEVARNDDGTYTVSGSVDGAVGVKLTDTGLDVGGGARVEFTADNAAQAREIADTLVKTGIVNAATATPTGVLAAPVTNFLYGPSQSELKQLQDNLSAVEIKGTAAGGVGARLGLTPDVDAGGGAGAEGDVTLRLEFEDGRPSAAAMRTTIQGNLEADGDARTGIAGLLPEQAVADVKRSTGVDARDVLGGGDASVSITVEHRVDLKSTATDTPGWRALTGLGTGGQSLPGIVPDGELTSKVTVSADGRAEAGRGIHAEMSVDGLNPSDAVNLARGLAKGDVRSALESVDAKIDYEVHGTHVQNDGLDADFIVGGVHATRTITRVDAPIVDGSIQIGGSSGKAGSSGTAGTNEASGAQGSAGGSATGSAGSAGSAGPAGPAGSVDRVNVVTLDDVNGVPYDPDFRATPDVILNPPNLNDPVGRWAAFEQHVGAEVGRSLNIESVIPALYRRNSPLQRNPVEAELLHAPRINAGGGGSGTKGSGGSNEPFRRPDWIAVQKDNAVLAVEATLDSNFQVKNVDGGIHKVTQLEGTLDALVNTFGQDRPIHYVIRSPHAPGAAAQRALDNVEHLLGTDPKYANVTVTWVTG